MTHKHKNLEGPGDELATDAQIANLRAIFDRDRIIATDGDLLELAKLLEDESNEDDLVIDHDFDFGPGN